MQGEAEFRMHQGAPVQGAAEFWNHMHQSMDASPGVRGGIFADPPKQQQTQQLTHQPDPLPIQQTNEQGGPPFIVIIGIGVLLYFLIKAGLLGDFVKMMKP